MTLEKTKIETEMLEKVFNMIIKQGHFKHKGKFYEVFERKYSNNALKQAYRWGFKNGLERDFVSKRLAEKACDNSIKRGMER